MKRVIAWALLLTVAAGAEETKLPVTADLGICAHPNETALNTGGNRVVRLKGNEHFYLFTVDALKLEDWRINQAWLHLRVLRGRPLNLSVCTVEQDWIEGSAVNAPQDGATCYTHLVYPETTWTPGGNTFQEATFNNPRMLWKPAETEVLEDGWIRARIDPRMVRALATGFIQGLAIAEDGGQTFENHDIYTRESDHKPYLVVKGQEVPDHADGEFQANGFVQGRGPQRVYPAESFADPRTGAASIAARAFDNLYAERVWLTGPQGRTRSIVSFAGSGVLADRLAPGRWSLHIEQLWQRDFQLQEPTRGHWMGEDFTARPAAGPVLPETPKRPARRPIEPAEGFTAAWLADGALPDPTGAKLPAARATVPETPRNAWASWQFAMTFPPGAKRELTVDIEPPVREATPGNVLGDVRLYRLWSVPHKGRWIPEVCDPLARGDRVDLPWARNEIPRQANQTFLAEVWVPADAPVGRYTGRVTLRDGQERILSVPLELDVAGPALSDAFDVVGSCNTYGSAARAMGVKPPDGQAFRDMEARYFRLAHSHRMAIAQVPYKHSGRTGEGFAPPLDGRDEDARIADWSDWDRRFAPLLSGQAFTAEAGYVGPGAGRGVDHFYLPFHENWPMSLASHFKPWPPPRDYRKFLEWSTELPPIRWSLGGTFHLGYTAVLKQFQQHLTARGWRDTSFQVYLNNKQYYRRNRGRGISLWLLDEPMHAIDFQALGFFGRMTRGATARAGDRAATIDFRVDISRPTHQRDWLDGAVDLNVCANKLRSQARQIALRKDRFGEACWNYAMPRSFGADHGGWALWPLRSYCWGATGTCVWQTIGSDGDLRKADATALILPGRKLGHDRPLATLRLKLWRDGIQLAQLLHQLRTRRRWSDNQLRAWVGGVCGLAGWRDGMHPDKDAPIVTFADLDAAGLARLRSAALAAISQPAP